MKMIKNISQILTFAIGVCLLGNCSKQAAQIPAYLSIEKIRFQPETNQGSTSSNIKYAFLYINDEFIGGYELPIDRIPILTTGQADVLIRAGIKVNGIATNPDEYPPYSDFQTSVNFAVEETTIIDPVVKYKDNIRFAINEDFDSENHKFQNDLDDDPETKIEIDGDGAFEGKSAKIKLNSDHNEIIVGTDFFDVLPNNNTPVWLEVDYKTDIPVIFGLAGVDVVNNFEQFPEFGINSNENWNKIYFDLSLYANLPEYLQFQLFFGASLAGEEGEILLDNIKLLYFEN